MKLETWRTLAIIFMTLFILETAFVLWSIKANMADIEKYNECLYDICGEYPDAYYADGICYCYEYDFLGDLVLAETEYMR